MEDYKKKYEDLITSLKKAKNDEMVRDDRFCVVIDNIVPELKESEDERIRKDIVEYLKSQGASRRWDFNTWVAWLEKQKPVEWSEEDEKMILTIISDGVRKVGLDEGQISWLKSIKPRWKPSDEMLEALYRVTPENVMEKSEDEMLLDKLYQGLKYGKVLSEK